MNLSNIKKLVLGEGKVILIDGDDALVVMSFNEYEKVKNKNLGLSSALLESRTPIMVEKLEPQTQPEPQLNIEKPTSELTLDDLPF